MRKQYYLCLVSGNLSDIRLICCVSGITAHIALIFRYIDLLYASKLRKSAFALPLGSLRLLMSDRLSQDKLLWTCQLTRSTVARAFLHCNPWIIIRSLAINVVAGKASRRSIPSDYLHPFIDMIVNTQRFCRVVLP